MNYTAKSKFLIVSPSKVRPVADLIRNKDYQQALSILRSVPNKGGNLIRKVLISAGENAKYRNRNLTDDMLYVSEIKIDEGPRLKRVWPRSHGRRDLLLKRMSHISVVVSEKAGN